MAAISSGAAAEDPTVLVNRAPRLFAARSAFAGLRGGPRRIGTDAPIQPACEQPI